MQQPNLKMNLPSIAVLVLACSVSAYGFACRNDDSVYYHADPSTGCQVYHLCDKSMMTTLTCPSGEAFDAEKLKCLEASSVTCTDNEHHRMKRSIQVHQIAIKDLKTSAEMISKEVAEAVKKFMQLTMPSIYGQVEKYFSPMVQFVADSMPLYREKFAPRVEKAASYLQKLSRRLFQKTYQTWELSNSTHLNIVSLDDVVSDVSKDLKPVLQMARYLSAKALNSRHKRSADDRSIQVHQIAIKDLKIGFETASKEMAEVVKKFMQLTLPSIYKQVEKYLSPMVQFVADSMPLYRETLAPRLEKAASYLQKLSRRLFQKTYQTWEMSNSTHLNIVSLDDIASDVSKDLKPVLQMARYLSTKALNSRHKRWADDIARSVGRPIAEDLFNSFLNFISGEQDTVMSKLVLPVVIELASDSETRFDMMKLIVAMKSAFAPVMNEMYKRQLHDTPPGTIVHLPRYIVDKAKSSFRTDSLPILGKIARKHLRSILRKSGENLPLITSEADAIHSGFGQRLRHEWVVFLEKHSSLFLADGSHDYTHIHTKTITEIMRDLQPMKSLIIEMFLNSMSTSPNALFKFFSRADTVMMRLMLK